MLKQRVDVVHDLIGAIGGPAFDVHDSAPAQCVDECQSVTRSLAGGPLPCLPAASRRAQPKEGRARA